MEQLPGFNRKVLSEGKGFAASKLGRIGMAAAAAHQQRSPANQPTDPLPAVALQWGCKTDTMLAARCALHTPSELPSRPQPFCL